MSTFHNTDKFSEERLRKEVKYLLNTEQYVGIRSVVSNMMDLDPNTDKYGEYIVRSLYFDTPDFTDYYDKLNSALIRRKIRLRTYGEPSDSNHYRLEEKYRLVERGGKAWCNLSEEEAKQVASGDYQVLESKEQRKNLYSALVGFGYSPVISINYVREAYHSPTEDLRVTFDSKVMFGAPLDFFNADVILNGHNMSEYIMEIKYRYEMPKWLSYVLRRYDTRVSTNSKYCDSIQCFYDI